MGREVSTNVRLSIRDRSMQAKTLRKRLRWQVACQSSKTSWWTKSQLCFGVKGCECDKEVECTESVLRTRIAATDLWTSRHRTLIRKSLSSLTKRCGFGETRKTVQVQLSSTTASRTYDRVTYPIIQEVCHRRPSSVCGWGWLKRRESSWRHSSSALAWTWRNFCVWL